MPADWSDPLYRPWTELPDGMQTHRFGSVEVGVVVADTDPGTIEASWLPDRGVTMTLLDDVPAAALAEALPAFAAYAASLADRPTTASITLPSRDVDRARVARSCGFAPSSVLAVACPPSVTDDWAGDDGAGDDTAGDDAAGGGRRAVVVRDATPSDAAAVGDLWCEQTDYEARVGTLRTSDRIRAAIRASVPLTVPGTGTALVAEIDGVVAGLLLAQSVEASAWAAQRLTVAPAAYLSVASTTSARRGAGVGRALVTTLHERHRAEGVAASVLHYGAHNPLSVPFWSRCGYRPLLTTFDRVVG